MKKTNKKGFTLIELIIVIAILAILIAALAPALLRYIEKSRVGKDQQTLDGVYEAIKTAISTEKINGYSTAGVWTQLSALASDTTDEGKALQEELFGYKDEDNKVVAGTLDAGFASATGDALEATKLFKSSDSKSKVVYYAITGEADGYKVCVCLAPAGNTGKDANDEIATKIGFVGETITGSWASANP